MKKKLCFYAKFDFVWETNSILADTFPLCCLKFSLHFFFLFCQTIITIIKIYRLWKIGRQEKESKMRTVCLIWKASWHCHPNLKKGRFKNRLRWFDTFLKNTHVQGAVEETKTAHLCILIRINYFAVFAPRDYKVNRKHRIKCRCNADDLHLYPSYSTATKTLPRVKKSSWSSWLKQKLSKKKMMLAEDRKHFEDSFTVKVCRHGWSLNINLIKKLLFTDAVIHCLLGNSICVGWEQHFLRQVVSWDFSAKEFQHGENYIVYTLWSLALLDQKPAPCIVDQLPYYFVFLSSKQCIFWTVDK